LSPSTILMIGKLVFAAVGLLAGVSLARTARRAGGFPPEAWASAMVFIGGGGLVAFAVGDAMGAQTSALVRAVIIGGDVLERLALALLYAFVWFVFRPDDEWAKVAAAAGICVLALSLAYELATGNLPYHDSASSAYQATQLAMALPFLWSAVETRLYHLRSRRQVALGLSEPMVCNRFLIWCAATAGFAGICLIAVAASLARAGGQEGLEGMLVAVRGALFLLVSGTVAIGFHPPAVYRRLVESRAPARSS
jgi:hypothetical protein